MWYRFGWSSGGYGNGPHSNYGPAPRGARTAVEVISRPAPTVTVGVYWSDTEKAGAREANPLATIIAHDGTVIDPAYNKVPDDDFAKNFILWRAKRVLSSPTRNRDEKETVKRLVAAREKSALMQDAEATLSDEKSSEWDIDRARRLISEIADNRTQSINAG